MSVLGHWVWLSRLQGLSPRTISSLLDIFGSPLEIYNSSESSLAAVPGIAENEISALLNRDMSETEAVIENCARLGVSILTLQDAAYPERLAAISNPPAVLYIKGKLPPLDGCPAISVVGSRNASAYGLGAAKKLAFDLASAGVIIVSGMALGCDAAAHSGAVEAGKPTLAVLGCGPDICYPPENHALFNDIPRLGAVISEYSPGTKPSAIHFPVRNRIISGLSNGVLVA
jgi:DNA processing protein